ncbi:MAG: prepilin-type N-terminal cleavage/methylation domain-containing protein [Microgenomates group bacterium]
MKRGFTLIEMLVVVGVLAIIMITVTSILANSFKAKNRVAVADLVEQNGALVTREIRNNIMMTAGIGVSCVVDGVSAGSTLALTNIDDGQVTNLVCYENSKIASESANGNFDLTTNSVKVTGCDNFARCDLYPDTADRVAKVNLLFNLSSGDTAVSPVAGNSKTFNSSVVVRN